MLLNNLRKSKVQGRLGELTKISCDVDGKELWCHFPNEYEKYTTDSYDAFVLMMFDLALLKGEDMIINGSISEQLQHQFEKKLIPSFCDIVYEKTPKRRIKILPEKLTSQKFQKTKEAVGAPLSCGVDSLHCFKEYYFDTECPSSLKITHATLYHSGFWGGTVEKRWDMFFACLDNSRKYIKQTNLKFLYVLSNVFDWYGPNLRKHHPEYPHGIGANYHFGYVNLFPKLFTKYWIPSAVDYSAIFSWQPDVREAGITVARLDELFIPMLSTENIQAMTQGANRKRVEKTREIMEHHLTPNHLNVCISPFAAGKNLRVRNCSRCGKCKRTLAALDYYKILDKYKSCFNLKRWEGVKDEYFKEIAFGRGIDFSTLGVVYQKTFTKELFELYGKDFFEKRFGSSK